MCNYRPIILFEYSLHLCKNQNYILEIRMNNFQIFLPCVIKLFGILINIRYELTHFVYINPKIMFYIHKKQEHILIIFRSLIKDF